MHHFNLLLIFEWHWIFRCIKLRSATHSVIVVNVISYNIDFRQFLAENFRSLMLNICPLERKAFSSDLSKRILITRTSFHLPNRFYYGRRFAVYLPFRLSEYWCIFIPKYYIVIFQFVNISESCHFIGEMDMYLQHRNWSRFIFLRMKSYLFIFEPIKAHLPKLIYERCYQNTE